MNCTTNFILGRNKTTSNESSISRSASQEEIRRTAGSTTKISGRNIEKVSKFLFLLLITYDYLF